MDRFQRQCNAFTYIVTTDENLLYLYEPESNQQSIIDCIEPPIHWRLLICLALNVLSTCPIVPIAPPWNMLLFLLRLKYDLRGKRFTDHIAGTRLGQTIYSCYIWQLVDCDIYNIWVDRHNKCVNCMGEYFDFFTSNCYVAVKGYNVKPL